MPEVAFRGVAFTPHARGVHFKGRMLLSADWDVRYTQTGNVPYSLGTMCEDTVEVQAWRARRFDLGTLPSRRLSSTKDPWFDADADSTAVGSLTHWETETISGITGAVVSTANGPDSHKAVEVTIGAGHYWRFRQKVVSPCMPGAAIRAFPAYWFQGTPYPSIQARCRFYDASMNELGTATDTAFSLTAADGTWSVPSADLRWNAPPGAAFYRVAWTISSATSGGTNKYRLSALHAWASNP